MAEAYSFPIVASSSRASSREYYLRPQVVAALEAIRAPRRELVFAWPFCLGTFYNRFERLLIAAELPRGRHCKLQGLRRSFASYLEAAGGDATRALAHTNRRTTIRSYIDPTITTRRPDCELLPTI